jgi:hypothetical protein
LKLLVNVTPVLPSSTKGGLVAAEALKPTLATIPSVTHAIAVKRTPNFLYMIFLYIDSVQPAFADVYFEPVWVLVELREAGWAFEVRSLPSSP